MYDYTNRVSPWYYNDYYIQKVTIKSGVKNIGNSAFSGCYRLNEISIPDSVTSIGNGSFEYCSSIESISIPNSVKSIGSDAFYGCTSLKNIEIPKSVREIGSYAFENCTNLQNITLNKGLKRIGSYAFDDCEPYTVEFNGDINDWAEISFDNFTANPSHFDETALFISGVVLEYQKEINLNKATVIGSYTFCNLKKLNLTIGNDVKSIENNAFNDCTLKKLTVPCNLAKASGFKNCKIDELVLKKGNSKIPDCDSKTYKKTLWYGNITKLVLENGIEKIGNYAFCEANIKNLVIPNSVKSIGKSSFRNCKKLTDVEIGNNVTKIGDCAFKGCTNLKNVKIGKKTEKISDYAFENTKIENLTIPYSVKNIGIGAFNVKKLDSGYEVDRIIDNVTITAGTGTINKNLFKDFMEASKRPGISHLEFANGVKSIPDNAFNGMRITEVVIPKSVKKIGSKAFYKSHLDKITIYSGVKFIGKKAFNTGSSYTKFYYIGKKAQYDNISKKGCGIDTVKCLPNTPNKIKLTKTKYVYDGKIKKPKFEVKDVNKKVVSPKNYTIIYNDDWYDSDYVGVYSAKIVFKNDYLGSIKRTFYIIPKAVSIKKLTAKSRGFNVKWEKNTTGTTGYEIQYSTSSDFKNKKTIKIKDNKITNRTISSLKGNTTYYVRVRAYARSTDDVYSYWSKTKTVTTKK